MVKVIKIKCLDQGKAEVERTKVIFDNEPIHLKVEYPAGTEAWTKYLDIIIGTQRETVIQAALSIDYIFKADSAGTLHLKPYSTLDLLDLKWETASLGIKKSLPTL